METVPKEEKKYRRMFAEQYDMTPRELEVFEKLIGTEDGVQTIADEMYISRRCLQRHIASIYEKTGTKSRIGLLRCYVGFRLGREIL